MRKSIRSRCMVLVASPRSWLVAAFLILNIDGAVASGPFGTYLRPFSAQSPWNIRPVSPVLDNFEIPKSNYYPTFAEGAWSTGVFLAASTDSPMQVRGLVENQGIWDPDGEVFQKSITVPHWPSHVIPASGTDGHADIVDPDSGIVHSFFQLKLVSGQWRAGQYAWTRIDGRGWGEPGHYFQGARAAAVPSMAGVIRKHEIADGDSMYRHALAMSLTYNGLSADPSYIFPATSSDADAAKTNSGRIPEGALLMLPSDFNTANIADPRVRKVAETLKIYGGYVVDRNIGTPFIVYVENGSNLNLHPPGGWNSRTGDDLDRMRAALRQVTRTSAWIDGEGNPVEVHQRLNQLSMRGVWRTLEGDGVAAFDTWLQAVVMEPRGRAAVFTNFSNRSFGTVKWARPVAGQTFRLTAQTTMDARFRLQIMGAGSQVLYDSGELKNGQSSVFEWPAGIAEVRSTAYAVQTKTRSTAKASLIAEPSSQKANAK